MRIVQTSKMLGVRGPLAWVKSQNNLPIWGIWTAHSKRASHFAQRFPLMTRIDPGSPRMFESSILGTFSFLLAWAVVQYAFFRKFSFMSEKSPSNSEELKAAEEKARRELDELSYVKELLQDSNWVLKPSKNEYNQKSGALTFSRKTLRGYGKVPCEPIVFVRKDKKESIAIFKIGNELCGYPGIVHGGFIATSFDTAMAGIALEDLSSKVVFTANLNINYRKPMPSGSYVVIRSKLEETEGRKIRVSSKAMSINEKVIYSDATGLFISPKPSLKSFVAFKLMPSVVE